MASQDQEGIKQLQRRVHKSIREFNNHIRNSAQWGAGGIEFSNMIIQEIHRKVNKAFKEYSQ